jgi:aspartyl-tRNA(Asn)/glutamyl-tRNA(Gln) amidotransferase subunit A
LETIDLEQATIFEVSKLLENKAVSPVELTRATLERIERINPRLNAYTTVTADYAMKNALKAEKEIVSGSYRGALHGIPYSLKDLIDTKGILTTYGYSSHQDYVPTTSAAVHELMEKAGAILVGKVDCHFRRNVPVECYNPWDLSRTPGHSSSGSGAAMAASLGLASIGSDTGGSVRLPAAHSGVVGMRSTFGLISRYNLFGPSWSFDQAGPLTKTVKDTAMMLDVIAQYDPRDPVSIENPHRSYLKALEGSIRGLKVGVLEEYVGNHCTEEVEKAMRNVIGVFRDLGTEVSEISIPNVLEVTEIHNTIVEPETAAYYYEHFPRERLEKIDPDMLDRLAKGASIPFGDYINAQTRLALLKRDLASIFSKVDLIIMPTSLTPALKIPDTKGRIIVRGREVNASDLALNCTVIASDTGMPSVSVPCGFTENSDKPLPIGLLIMGRHLEDDLVLKAAFAYEQANDWYNMRPSLW